MKEREKDLTGSINMASYFAVFMPVKEGGYAVEFPDIPEAFTQGADLDECLLMGADVLAIAVEEYARTRKELPPPSSFEAIESWADAQKDDPALAPDGRFIFQLFRAPAADMTPVRVNISLPKAVLEEIDAKAAAGGFTRSGFLAKAAQEYQM